MKRPAISLLLALVMALSLTACRKPAPGGENPASPPVTAPPAVSAAPTPAPVYDDSLIEDALSEEGGEGYYAYSYHVPRLAGEGAVIAAINEELDGIFGAQARRELEDMAVGSLPFYHRIWWESHWTDSLLSLVVQAENIDRQVSAGVIYYDFARDERLNGSGFLQRLGISREEFLSAARRAVIQEFDARCQADPDLHREMSLYYESYYGDSSILSNRVDTLASVAVENAILYQEDGVCYTIATLVLGGAGNDGWYSSTLALDFDPPSEDMIVGDDAVTATLENGRVFLSCANWEALPPDMDPDRSYEVKGLYSNYTDLFLGDLSGNYRPVLFLLTDQGTLEYVDIGQGIWYGTFCAMPIPGDFTGVTFENVVTDGVEGRYFTTYACWPDGSMEDLGLWVFCAERATPRGNWSGILEEISEAGGSYARVGNLSFQSQELDFSITELDETVESGFAQLQALGMTEAGVVCGCTQSPYNGPAYAGAFAYRSGFVVEGDRYYKSLLLDLLTGTSPFGEAGQQITFQRSTEE